MKFKIDQKIFENYQEAIIGVVIAKGVDNMGIAEEVSSMLRAEENRIGSKYLSETLSQDPRIDSWRKVYSSFGVKPKDAKSSVETLYKMVLRGIALRQINTLVDIYNYISLKYMVPVGGEDIDKMVGDLQLTLAKDEKPVKLLGDAEPEAPINGEAIYKDDDSTICRRWNWREADRTKLTPETKNAILVIEGMPPVTREEMSKGIRELAERIEKFCGGSLKTYILDKNVEEAEI